jgi:crossover junction endodeoxyribonuclease RuvC
MAITPSKKVASNLILGFDPGLAITGYGILAIRDGKPKLVEAGVLRISRAQSLEKRLLELHQGVIEILDSHPISSVAIEQLYSHYERPRTAILMGHARGVLCMSAAMRGMTVNSYAATKVKKILTGNGRAPKSQMQSAVALQLNLAEPPDPPDVADAIAVALCHYFESRSIVNRALQRDSL